MIGRHFEMSVAVYQKRDGSWAYRIGDADGDRFSFGGFPTRGAAWFALAQDLDQHAVDILAEDEATG